MDVGLVIISNTSTLPKKEMLLRKTAQKFKGDTREIQ